MVKKSQKKEAFSFLFLITCHYNIIKITLSISFSLFEHIPLQSAHNNTLTIFITNQTLGPKIKMSKYISFYWIVGYVYTVNKQFFGRI